MIEISFRTIGVSPLLMHSAAAMVAPAAGVGQKRIPTPTDEAERGCYRLPSGQLYLPSIAFRASMLGAAKGRRIGKQAARGVLSGAMFTAALHVPLENEKGKPLTDYEVDVQRVVVQRQGVMRARPRIDAWTGVLQLEYDADFLKEDWLREFLEIAGKTIGVGDYRPERGGPYGRFRVEPI